MEKQEDYLKKLQAKISRKRIILDNFEAAGDLDMCQFIRGEIFAIEMIIKDYDEWHSD